MTLLAQLTDLHIAAPGELVLGRVDTAGFLARAVDRLCTLAPRPDAVVITGDLVEGGTRAEYAHLRTLLAPLPMPVHLLLGNHDIPAAFTAELARPTRFAADIGALRLLALDTHAARCPAADLAWLAAELAADPRPTIVALHHPPFATGIGFMDDAALDADDAAALAAVIAAHPHVERVISGHVHRTMFQRFAGTLASTAPSCAHQVALELRDAAGAYTLEPPGFQLHLWTGRALVTHHAYVDAAPTHLF